MSQDKLILIYSIPYAFLGIIPFSKDMFKEYKKNFFLLCFTLLIFIVGFGLVAYFFLILFWATIQLFTKNFTITQILLNIPTTILLYKTCKVLIEFKKTKE